MKIHGNDYVGKKGRDLHREQDCVFKISFNYSNILIIKDVLFNKIQILHYKYLSRSN